MRWCVADQRALLRAWLEEEGERQRRLPLLTSPAKDPSPRGWVQVGICAILGTLTVALLACWLDTGWYQANRLTAMEQLRLEGLRRAVGDPSQSAWWKGSGATARRSGDTLGAELCFRVFAIAFGTVIGALFLHAGCLLYNKLAGSANHVPIPVFGKAMGITFVTALVNASGGLGLLSALASFLVMAAMISALLPTTFTRGLLVSVCYLLVGLVVIVVLGAVFGGLFLVLAHLR
jgi:hypothetical protein